MSANDEKIRLALEMVGFDAIQGATKKLEELGQQGAETAAALGRGELSASEAEAEFKLLSATYKSVTDSIRDMTKALAEQDREELAAAKAGEELARATKAAAAADRELNDALRSDEITQTKQKLSALENELEALTYAYNRGHVTRDQYMDGQVNLGNQALLTKQKLDALEKEVQQVAAAERAATGTATSFAAAQTRVVTATATASGGLKNLGSAALMVSQGLEDMQYGLNGVINNIPGVVLAIGGGMGLAAGISVLAVGVNQLTRHWHELSTAFGGPGPAIAIDEVETLSKRIDELKNKKVRLSIETSELTEAEKRLKALQAAMAEADAQAKRQTVHEAAAGKLGQEAIDESATGAGGIAARITKQIEDQLVRDSDVIPAAKKEITKAQEDIKSARQFEREHGADESTGNMIMNAERIVAAENDRIAEAKRVAGVQATQRYGEITGGMREGSGAGQVADRDTLAAYLRSIGEHDVAGQVSMQTADFAKRQSEAKTEYERVLKGAKEQETRDKAAATARQAEVSRHAGILGTNKALGGDIAGDLNKQIAGGMTDPGALRAAVLAETETKIKGSGMVPPGLVSDVTKAVLDRVIEKTIGELLGDNLNIVQAAKDAAAEAQKKIDDKTGRAAAATARVAPKRAAAAEVEHVAGLISGDQGLTRGVRFTGPQATAAAKRAVAAFDQAGEAGFDPMEQRRMMQDAVDQVLTQMQQALQGRRRRPVGGGLQSVPPSPMPDGAALAAGEAFVGATRQGLAAQSALTAGFERQAMAAMQAQQLYAALARRAQQNQPTALNMGSFP